MSMKSKIMRKELSTEARIIYNKIKTELKDSKKKDFAFIINDNKIHINIEINY